MEAIVCGCVGVLCAVGVNVLLGAKIREDFADARALWETRRADAWRFVRASMGKAERRLLTWGIVTPRMRSQSQHAEEQLPEAFGALAISLGSGLSLMQSVRYVGGHADEPIRTEFLRAASEMGCGISSARALDDLVERLRVPGLELVALALKVSRRTGAPLADLLAEAAQLASERVELARRLDVKTSQARMSARLVSWMPVGMMGFLMLVSGDFRAGVATFEGMFSLVIALGLNLVAAMVIHRIMQVKL